MTTDITELAQILKAAANTTAAAIDRLKAFPGDELIDLSQHEGEHVDIDIATLNQWYELSSPANILALVEALEHYKSREERVTSLVRDNSKSWDELYRQVEAKGKRNVELVEALESEKRICATWRKTAEANSEKLEKAQQQMTESENRVRKQNRHICELFDDNTALRQRIAGLEARTVNVKQGEVLVTVAGFTGCGKSAIAGEIEIAMKAIGLPVTWANGDSEKRMTGADWLTAIEMYKPTVRIVEVNIPRAAGIKVEAE